MNVEFGTSIVNIEEVNDTAYSWINPAITALKKAYVLRRIDENHKIIPNDSECSAAALEALLILMGSKTPLPNISRTNYGGVQLEWNIHGIELVIDFDTQGNHVYYNDEKTGTRWFQDFNLETEREMPERLYRRLLIPIKLLTKRGQ